MQKKSLFYTPARIVKGLDRWYILYYQYNEITDREERFRPTFKLNKIKSKKDRRARAVKLRNWLNKEVLPKGRNHLNYHIEEEKKLRKKNALTIRKATDIASSIRQSDCSKNGLKGFTIRRLRFFDYLTKTKSTRYCWRSLPKLKPVYFCICVKMTISYHCSLLEYYYGIRPVKLTRIKMNIFIFQDGTRLRNWFFREKSASILVRMRPNKKAMKTKISLS